MHKIITLLLIATSLSLSAQDYHHILQEIEQNNPELLSAQKNRDVQKLASKTGNLPPNPVISYGYFPGEENSLGTKKTFGIMQNLEFPSVYFVKRSMIDAQNKLSDSFFQQQRLRILLAARNAILTKVYTHKRLAAYEKHFEWVKRFELEMISRHEKGDVSILAVKKARMQTSRISNQILQLKQTRSSDSLYLVQLNHGKELSDEPTMYPSVRNLDLDKVIEQYISSHPENNLAKQNTDLQEKQIRLKRQQYLPDISVGYESEEVLGNRYAGVRGGIAIPLWAKKNTIKVAQQTYEVKVQQQIAIAHRIEIEAKTLVSQWKSEQKAYKNFAEAVTQFNTIEETKKAYDLGEISSTELFVELEYYFSLVDELLLQEYRMQMAQSNAFYFEL